MHTYKPDTDTPVIESQYIDTNEEINEPHIKKELGIIGLGKMGGNTARRLMEKGWHVVGYNRSPGVTKDLETEGITGVYTFGDVIKNLSTPRVIWLSLPAGDTIDELLFGDDGITKLLNKQDVIIDGGNSFYKDSVRRAEKLNAMGLRYIDVGFSGGPGGARNGASLMIGGNETDFKQYESLFADLALPHGYQFFPGFGAGHFVKMVHNGIEYGMMQAIAEGFAVLKQSSYHLDLTRISDVYNHGSVIESKLVGWLKNAFTLYGEELQSISGSVSHTGEGMWTVETAKELNIKTKIIEGALQFRIDSEKNPSYTGQIVSALRNQFGGHSVKK
jgi:6-phosphogluconate dehydrogenase